VSIKLILLKADYCEEKQSYLKRSYITLLVWRKQGRRRRERKKRRERAVAAHHMRLHSIATVGRKRSVRETALMCLA